MRTLTKDTPENIGQEVTIMGWVHSRRDHGKLIFIDLRDRWGIVQVVFAPKEGKHLLGAESLRDEWVIKLQGKVKERPKNMQNTNLETGVIELEATELEILSEAKTPPLPITTDGHDIEEETRLKYRYLDLRRPRMQKNLLLRYEATKIARDYLARNGFIEIETPLLTKTSPEGARDFVIPSRIYPGKFFALPQSPQQYKQLLMLAGFERYFQIAKCPRDEDSRGDRQPEHTQIDLEMSFVSEKDVQNLVEDMMIEIAEGCGKRVAQKPFPVFTHEEAVQKFGADKFDLRGEDKDPNEMAFAWVVDFPVFEWDEVEKRFTFAHNPFSAPKPEDVEKLMREEDLGSLRAQQYDLVCNGYELASGGVRISDPKVQRKVFEIMGLTSEQIEERFGHILEAYEYAHR